jgi:hypothetical protein
MKTVETPKKPEKKDAKRPSMPVRTDLRAGKTAEDDWLAPALG